MPEIEMNELPALKDFQKTIEGEPLGKTTKTPSVLKESFRPRGASEEICHAKRFFNMSWYQVLILIGIAISGLATFINIYNMASKINDKVIACSQDPDLKKAFDVQFIFMIVVSCLAILLGIIIAWALRTRNNQRRLLTLGLVCFGIFGIIYALSIRYQSTTNIIKFSISGISLLAFIIMGFFLSPNGIMADECQKTS
jgi:MFS family permease